jgi:hypothetical protein
MKRPVPAESAFALVDERSTNLGTGAGRRSRKCEKSYSSGRGGRRQNPIRADHLRRATGLSMFGLLDYRGWPGRRLHSPRAERMKVKPPSAPSAQSVQTKKKPPVDLAISP